MRPNHLGLHGVSVVKISQRRPREICARIQNRLSKHFDLLTLPFISVGPWERIVDDPCGVAVSALKPPADMT
jgi:hypothetical protein